ncbi:unnamed protein product [Prorocentrum cordatum]|uniref:Uncharacterized protein n=1 Tax=Prorocentrum cordatum TaxID=2364126 RepID=A0ABN9WN85_9DINO|nr:unnamed protein product [Polarella glacialis]
MAVEGTGGAGGRHHEHSTCCTQLAADPECSGRDMFHLNSCRLANVGPTSTFCQSDFEWHRALVFYIGTFSWPMRRFARFERRRVDPSNDTSAADSARSLKWQTS